VALPSHSPSPLSRPNVVMVQSSHLNSVSSIITVVTDKAVTMIAAVSPDHSVEMVYLIRVKIVSEASPVPEMASVTKMPVPAQNPLPVAMALFSLRKSVTTLRTTQTRYREPVVQTVKRRSVVTL
jgi:hypothetical protein